MDRSSYPVSTLQNVGRKALSKSTASGRFVGRGFGPRYRVKARKKKFGGVGLDEMVRTSTTRRTLARLLPGKFKSQEYKDAESFIDVVSPSRIDTDRLVWYHQGGLAGHPGALKKVANTLQHIVHGHGMRDRHRAKAVEQEFEEVSKTNKGMLKFVEAAHHMAVRGQVETVRTMMSPYEEFENKGRSGLEANIWHSEFGNVKTDKTAFNKMAAAVHNARETLKWQTASHMMGLGGMDSHVPKVMQQYLGKHKTKSGHEVGAAIADFTKNYTGTINTATTSKAGALTTAETLRGTNTAVATGGRKRALSNPRMFRP